MPRPEENEGVSPLDKRRESAPGRDNKCNGPGVGVYKVCSNKCKKAHVCVRQRAGED